GAFIKGYVGAGTITDGQLNDEDFPAGTAYSNTFSNAIGNLSYATVDLGYTFLKNVFGMTGIFIGYNYYAPNVNIYNCTQVAGSDVCVPSNELTNLLVLSEFDQWNSVRLGLNSEFSLSNQISLSSDVAYLPYVRFSGLDMHNARALVGPETANRGDGAMLEAILNYQISNFWNIGLGGRYWMWNMRNGQVLFDFLGDTDELITEPARFNADRYGVFLQVNYHPKQSTLIQSESAPSWKGIFIGGSVGGVWSHSYWSDPFASTPAAPGYFNVSGFGDDIYATGALGGVELRLSGQTGQLVYGVAANISGANIRGENTLFSGLSGINGQEISNYLMTIVARVGTPLNRSLFYINAGRAVLHTEYNINANNNVVTLGVGSQTIKRWGWTGGVGVEYAFNDSWSTNVEYDYVRIPNANLSFPAVELNNDQPISAYKNMNLFKVGFNYKVFA
ncbi:MAG: porin family protein, partial [Legionella sp.]